MHSHWLHRCFPVTFLSAIPSEVSKWHVMASHNLIILLFSYNLESLTLFLSYAAASSHKSMIWFAIGFFIQPGSFFTRNFNFKACFETMIRTLHDHLSKSIYDWFVKDFRGVFSGWIYSFDEYWIYLVGNKVAAVAPCDFHFPIQLRLIVECHLAVPVFPISGHPFTHLETL